MEKKKILILLILFVAIGGLTVSSVVATKTYQTGKLYFKDESDRKHSSFPIMKIDSKRKNDIYGFYVYPKASSQFTPNTVYIGIGDMDHYPDYKITKVVINFKKKVNNKVEYSTKTFKNKDLVFGDVQYSPKNNFKPNYAIVYYQKIKK